MSAESSAFADGGDEERVKESVPPHRGEARPPRVSGVSRFAESKIRESQA